MLQIAELEKFKEIPFEFKFRSTQRCEKGRKILEEVFSEGEAYDIFGRLYKKQPDDKTVRGCCFAEEFDETMAVMIAALEKNDFQINSHKKVPVYYFADEGTDIYIADN